MRQRLFDLNIGTSIHYVSLHLHEYYAKRFGFKPMDFPIAKKVSEQTISLPFSDGLSKEDVQYVIGAVKTILS